MRAIPRVLFQIRHRWDFDCQAPRALDGRRSLRSLQLFQRAAAAEECPTTFSDVGMHDAVFEILDVDHRRLVRFLPTDQEDSWPDGRDRNLHGLRGPLVGTLSGCERHHRLRFEVEMMDPAPEIGFIHVVDSWKVDRGYGLLLSRRLYRCLGMDTPFSRTRRLHTIVFPCTPS